MRDFAGFLGSVRPWKAMALAGLTIVAASGSVGAQTPLGGLTVAVSPAGDRLAAGGDNRAIYTLDPATLAVKGRSYLGTTILGMAFDAAGKTLAVSDTSQTLHLLDAETLKVRQVLRECGYVAFSAVHSRAACLDRGGQARAISVYGLSDGKLQFQVKFEKGAMIAALGISPDGKTLAALFGGNDDPAEPKVAYSAIPKDLKGQDRTVFQQKNDGKTSQVRLYDIASGKVLSDTKTFFTMNQSKAIVAFVKGGLVFNGYNNEGLLIGPSGGGRMVRFEGSYLYGRGASHDGRYLMSGSLRDFAVIDTQPVDASGSGPDLIAGAKGALDKLPGWPEYFSGFDATADGKAFYGATSAYRVLKFGADGKVLAIAPAL